MQPNKKILYGENARKELKVGIDAVVNAVKVTLGPSGRNVAMSRGNYTPIITNDGVSIARQIKLEDPVHQMGVAIAQETAGKTDKVAGDGTTTTLILLQAIIEEGMAKIENKTNVMEVRRGIESAVEAYIERLREKAIPVVTRDEVLAVAKISVEDDNIAKIITDVLMKVGVKGIVTVQESEKKGVVVDLVNGMKLDKGYAHPYIVNNYEKAQGEYHNVPVLVTDKKILLSEDYIPLLKELASAGNKDLLIIADDIDGEALASFLINKAQDLFNVIPVRFNTFGEGMYDELEDVAIKCGTFVLGERSSKQIKDMTIADLGFVSTCIVRVDTTMLIDGAGDVTARIEALEKQKEVLETSGLKDIVDRRIGNMLANVAVIKVGGDTETERRYLKLKVDDAVNAVRGAMEEGVVDGGGYALADIAYTDHNYVGDTEIGIRIINDAVLYPYKQLLQNCGLDINFSENFNGYNAKTGNFSNDLIAEGVVDPVKTTINALRNAASAAGMFLTTEVVVADVEGPKDL